MSQISHKPEREREGEEGVKEWDKWLSSLMPVNAASLKLCEPAAYSPGDQIPHWVSKAEYERQTTQWVSFLIVVLSVSSQAI